MLPTAPSWDHAARTEAFAADDRRIAARVMTVANFAKLVVSGREQPCEVHDLSNRGMRLEAESVPAPGQRVWVEMRGLDRTPAIVVWSAGKRAGLAFTAKQDLQAIFGIRGGEEPVPSPPQPGLYLRSPRFAVRMKAELVGSGGLSRHHVIDISLGGIKLIGDTPLKLDEPAEIRLGRLVGTLRGRVRWKQDDALGIRFDAPLPREELFRILAGTDYALSL